MTSPADQTLALLSQQTAATVHAANSSSSQAAAAWCTFGVAVIAALVNATVVFVAVVGPSSQRRLDRLQHRVARRRLYRAAVKSGLSALSQIRDFEKFCAEVKGPYEGLNADLERWAERILTASELLDQHLSGTLADSDIAALLVETRSFLRTVRRTIEAAPDADELFAYLFGLPAELLRLESLQMDRQRVTEALDARRKRLNKRIRSDDAEAATLERLSWPLTILQRRRGHPAPARQGDLPAAGSASLRP